MAEEATTDSGAKVGGIATFPTSAEAALSAASRKAVDAHSEAKRGRGRPPGSKTKNYSDGGMGQQKVFSPVETPPPIVDREFIEKTVEAGLKVLDGMVTRKIHASVLLIDPSLDKFAEEFVKAAALAEGEITMAAKTVGALAEKYPRLFGYAPEITLGIFTLSYGARVMTTFGDIKKLAAAVKEDKRAKMREGMANASPS